ncbi:hypothetical protein D3C84_1221860 [compost metagenome]
MIAANSWTYWNGVNFLPSLLRNSISLTIPMNSAANGYIQIKPPVLPSSSDMPPLPWKSGKPAAVSRTTIAMLQKP